MTVRELREKLAALPDHAVVCGRDNGDGFVDAVDWVLTRWVAGADGRPMPAVFLDSDSRREIGPDPAADEE